MPENFDLESIVELAVIAELCAAAATVVTTVTSQDAAVMQMLRETRELVATIDYKIALDEYAV